jgi:hypothetical protein
VPSGSNQLESERAGFGITDHNHADDDAGRHSARLTRRTALVAGASGIGAVAISGVNAPVALAAASAETALYCAACVATSNVSSLSGLQTFDGYTLTANQVVLLVGQTTGSQNGLWIAATGSWTRPTDFSTGDVVGAVAAVIIQGTQNGGSIWLLQTDSTITVGTDSETWVLQLPPSVANVTSPSGNKLPVFYLPVPSGDATGATDSAAIAALISALPSAGSYVIEAQSGTYYLNATISLNGTTAVTLRGQSGMTGGGAAGTYFRYVGTSSPFINARSTDGFQLRDLMVVATNSGFAGNLIDLSHDATLETDSALWEIRDCYLGITAANGTVIYLDDAISGRIAHNNIQGGAIGIQGVAVSGHYSNAITIDGANVFQDQSSAQISGPGQGWKISGNTFELAAVAAIVQAFGAQSGGEISGNWFGDATGSQTVITVGSGVSVRGNFISGAAGTTGVSVPAGAGAIVKCCGSGNEE